MSLSAAPTTASIDGTWFAAFGSTIGVWVTEPRQLALAETILRQWVQRVDRTCSRFRADSDLNRANNSAGTPVLVAPELLDAVTAALEMAEASGGWYDPTVGQAVVAAGYDRSITEIEGRGPGALGPAAPAGRWSEVEMDRQRSTLRVPLGTLIDLGGCAKGWAADRAVALLSRALGEATGICVNAGGDLAVGGPAPAEGWPVRISHSLHGSPAGGDLQVGLQSGALATSGMVRRHWRIDGQEFHHLVNPRTGRPGAEHWRLVTVHADRCAIADPAATVAWLMGCDAPAWLESQGLTARLVHRDGSVRWVGSPGQALDLEIGAPL
ncbi:MAG: FAD:protein FMN transferase [Candidatus Dormibacteria bacterium]